MRPLIQMHNIYDTLSSSQRAIADYILMDPIAAAELGIEDLSAACELSKTTVIRFLKKVGYDSYRTYRTDLIREIAVDQSEKKTAMDFLDYMNVYPDDDEKAITQKVTSLLSQMLSDLENILDYDALRKTAHLMENARNILFFATGGTDALALDVYHKFLRMGLPVFHEENSHLALTKAGLFTSNDVSFLISRTGESREVIECAYVTKKRKGKVIVLTSNHNSTLANMADVVLYCSTYDATFSTGYMVSRFMQLTILDILFLCVRRDLEPRSSEAVMSSRKTLEITKGIPEFLKNSSKEIEP